MDWTKRLRCMVTVILSEVEGEVAENWGVRGPEASPQEPADAR